jgi:hypothetical protein
MFSSIFIYFKIFQSLKFRFKVKSRILSWVTSKVQLYQVGSLKVQLFKVQLVNSPTELRMTELQTTQLGTTELWKWPQLRTTQLQKFNNDIIIWSSGIFQHSVFWRSNPMFSPIRCWVSFDIGYFLCLVFCCWVPIWCCVLFDVQLFDVQSFDVQSFDIQLFDVESFDVQSFDVRSFDVLSFDVQEVNFVILCRVIKINIVNFISTTYVKLWIPYLTAKCKVFPPPRVKLWWKTAQQIIAAAGEE